MLLTQELSSIIAAGIPMLAVIASFVRNESSTAALASRITSLETRLDARILSLENKFDARIETLGRDLRDWAKITMQHNTDIALLKDKADVN